MSKQVRVRINKIIHTGKKIYKPNLVITGNGKKISKDIIVMDLDDALRFGSNVEIIEEIKEEVKETKAEEVIEEPKQEKEETEIDNKMATPKKGKKGRKGRPKGTK